MASNTYTEDEFKQVLKNLFSEKKKVKELQKQLEEGGLQKKFQTKLADIHKLSLAEEYAKLKSAYSEKEKEDAHLKKNLEVVRPALKKLVAALKSAHQEIAALKAQPSTSHVALEEAQAEIKKLEAEKLKLSEEVITLQNQCVQWQAEIEGVTQKNRELEEGAETLQLKMDALAKTAEEERGERARAKANEQKEIERFEGERGRLVEKLAETLSQIQRQSEMLKDLREAEATLHRQLLEKEQHQKSAEQTIEHVQSELSKSLMEAARNQKITEYQLTTLRSENEELHAKVSALEQATKERLPESDLTALAREYEAKLGQKEVAHEEVLERSYAKMKELSERQGTVLQERDAEIRKAQQHLAKKVKEATILRDLVERQKGQLIELQALCDKQTNEIDRMQSSLNLQRMHDEKVHAMAKERTQAAEIASKEWQEKYLALQQDWQEKKGQLIELQKMRKTYDQMATTFSSLKNILGNSLEPPSSEDPQNSGN